MRPTCFACYRPQSHCVCQLIPRFRAHCNLLILQHPHERKKYYSTAKMVTSAIENARLLRGLTFSDDELSRVISNRSPYLLFPGAESRDCGEVSLDENDVVIVLDGTWSEAGKLLRLNPQLKTFPRLSFSTPYQSTYRIRRQPRQNYLSTLESIGYLLTLSAEGQGLSGYRESYQSLFTGFNQMVEKQLAYFPRVRNGTATIESVI